MTEEIEMSRGMVGERREKEKGEGERAGEVGGQTGEGDGREQEK